MTQLTVQLDTRPSGTDVSSPMSEPNGRGSGTTANPIRGEAMQTAQSSARRVRHEVADALRLAAFSLAASVGVALLLSVCSHLVGAK
jgi:hypothetical protein